MQLDFEIDKLTHSHEDANTGEVLATEILPLEKEELKDITKKNGWKFNWKTEFSNTKKQVYKLVLSQQKGAIQGLVCLEIMSNYLFMHLIEIAPHNFGKNKKYFGEWVILWLFAAKCPTKKVLTAKWVLTQKRNLLSIM